MKTRCAIVAFAVVFAVVATRVVHAQDFGSRQPSVTYEPPELTSIDRGHLGGVRLQFRISPGFHINSNQPRQDYLKKTELRLDAPTDIAVVGLTYPEGVDRSFPFAPKEKLNVYTGDFAIRVLIRPLSTVLAQRYAFHGVLKYQACDNAACYPPKQLPVSFEIRVLKGVHPHRRRNPAQSPHVHQ
jgi:Thiol:disulfide interchange protein DsbD, N-terminal